MLGNRSDFAHVRQVVKPCLHPRSSPAAPFAALWLWSAPEQAASKASSQALKLLEPAETIGAGTTRACLLPHQVHTEVHTAGAGTWVASGTLRPLAAVDLMSRRLGLSTSRSRSCAAARRQPRQAGHNMACNPRLVMCP